MADNDSADPTQAPDAARRSEDAGIADETAAFENSARKGAPPSIDEGDPRTKEDGSGTSETD